MPHAGEGHRNAQDRSDKPPLPPVLKPGTARAYVDGGAQSVRDLTAQLKTAKGTAALRIATELTKARRAMNGGG
jgi:hypothetical protein